MKLCKKCNKEIVFLRTKGNKPIPVDADTVTAKEKAEFLLGSDVPFDPKRHKTHFATCPFVTYFRKPKTNKDK